MRKNSSGVIWGIMLILIGVAIGARVLDWFDFNLFFRGWWTLFIIIPSAIKFFTEKGERITALKGLCAGLLLLMAAQGFIEYRMFFPLLLAAFLVLTGIRMIALGGRKKRQDEGGEGKRGRGAEPDYMDAARYRYEDEYDGSYYEEEEPNDTDAYAEQGFDWSQYADRRQYRRGQEENKEKYYQEQSKSAESSYWEKRRNIEYYPRKQEDLKSADKDAAKRNGRCVCTAIFSGKDIHYSHEVFDGAMLSCVLGGITLNLEDALLYRNVVIEAKAFLGGIDIFVPENVRVVVNQSAILGGVDNHVKQKAPLPPDALTISIDVTCVLGGVEIKRRKKSKGKL